MTILMLNGGGLDSCAQLVLAYRDGKKVTSFHVDYGQISAQAEYRAIKKVSNILHYPHIQFKLSSMSSNHPLFTDHPSDRKGFEMNGRNLMLLAIAGVYADLNNFGEVMVAFNTAPAYYPDARPQFVQEVSLFFLLSGIRAKIIAPYMHMTKLEAVLEALQFQVPILDVAHSCYKAEECGVCPHCIQKKDIETHVRDIGY